MPIDTLLRQQAEVATQNHWNQFSDPLDSDRINHYIENILPLELRCAQSDGDEPSRLPPEDQQNGVLVLLVGFSIDPLLQSICAYKPTRVVLVLNSRYGETPGGLMGQAFGNYVAGFFPKLPPDFVANQINTENANVEFYVLGKDHPTNVFRKLREELIPRLQKGERLVLDITGGKKSMVAGAFLFGAFTGVSISYVDFEEFDSKSRTPRGYTCRIGILPNPYEIFRLRDWERVRELYDRYMFLNTGRLLDEIIPSMSGWFSEGEINATETLRKVMTIYELWDNGDYRSALVIHKEINCKLKGNLRLPTAVQVLGQNDYWPYGEEAGKLLNDLKDLEFGKADRPSLYFDPHKLFVYAFDELTKVERLIEYNEDYRSALLRAVGLMEVLLRARLLISICAGKVEIALKPSDNESPIYQVWGSAGTEVKEWQSNIIEQIIKHDSVYSFIPALRYRANGPSDERRPTKLRCSRDKPKHEEREFLLRRTSEAPLLSEDAVPNMERDLRNKAIHTYLSIPRSVAIATLDIARRSVNDFAERWVILIPSEKVDVWAERIPWSELCNICGIDFLPL